MEAVASHLPEIVARHPVAADTLVNRRPTIDDGLSVDLQPGSVRFFRALGRR